MLFERAEQTFFVTILFAGTVERNGVVDSKTFSFSNRFAIYLERWNGTQFTRAEIFFCKKIVDGTVERNGVEDSLKLYLLK